MDAKKIEITSKKYWLNSKDYVRGILVAMGTAAAMMIQTSLDAGQFEIKWKPVLMAAISAGLAYLVKNYFQPQQVKKDVTPEEVAEIKSEVQVKDAAK